MPARPARHMTEEEGEQAQDSGERRKTEIQVLNSR